MGQLKKTGCIIAVKEGMLDRYIQLHRNQPEEIRTLMKACGFRKCEIFVKQIGGVTYLFQYNEFDGDDAPLYEDPAYKEWLRVTGECQQPLPGETFWQDLPQVYALTPEETE